MGKGLKLALALGAVALLTATAAFAASDRGTASDTLVYGASADPALLDPSLTSDGESLRPTGQIFDSLVGFKKGTSIVVPSLATGWTTSKNQPGVDVQAAQGSPILGRHALQRGGGLRELHALVLVPGAAAERRLELLLADGLRRIRQAGTGRSRA